MSPASIPASWDRCTRAISTPRKREEMELGGVQCVCIVSKREEEAEAEAVCGSFDDDDEGTIRIGNRASVAASVQSSTLFGFKKNI